MKNIYPKLSQKIDSSVGMFVGLAIGDAMGAPIEFQRAREPEEYVREYRKGGAHNVSLGEFTDDTSMALAMADAFIQSCGFNPYLIMDNFVRWKNNGAYSPRGIMFDCGITVGEALRKYEDDKSTPFVGKTDIMSAGNGGLMRLAPAIIAARSEEQAVHYARESTRLTHGAEEALFYSELLAKELWNKTILKEYDDKKHPLDIKREDVMSGGYVKETYQAAWWAFQTTTTFEDCIIKAINRGHDSDTTGAVAGMIAGAIYGFNAIPKWMVEQLQWVDEIIFQAIRLKLGKAGFHMWLENCLYSADASQGILKSIFGRKSVCINPLANYGGGSRQLWAVEGVENQYTTQRSDYVTAKCISVTPEIIIMDGKSIELNDIQRFDFEDY